MTGECFTLSPLHCSFLITNCTKVYSPSCVVKFASVHIGTNSRAYSFDFFVLVDTPQFEKAARCAYYLCLNKH